MIVRCRDEVKVVDWGNGTSYRFLLESDGMGFTLCHTVVRAGTKSPMQYRRHLEACYCIAGKGAIVTGDGGTTYELQPGVMYALNDNDSHYLLAETETDLELISVFNPPLQGHERHRLDSSGFSQY
jgi:L-ectoine synthase